MSTSKLSNTKHCSLLTKFLPSPMTSTLSCLTTSDTTPWESLANLQTTGSDKLSTFGPTFFTASRLMKLAVAAVSTIPTQSVPSICNLTRISLPGASSFACIASIRNTSSELPNAFPSLVLSSQSALGSETLTLLLLAQPPEADFAGPSMHSLLRCPSLPHLKHKPSRLHCSISALRSALNPSLEVVPIVGFRPLDGFSWDSMSPKDCPSGDFRLFPDPLGLLPTASSGFALSPPFARAGRLFTNVTALSKASVS